MEHLIGKTIKNAVIKKYEGYNDEPLLELEFTDGTFTYVEASYGGYSGKSVDEYPCYVGVSHSESEMRTEAYVDYGDELTPIISVIPEKPKKEEVYEVHKASDETLAFFGLAPRDKKRGE